VPLAEGESGAFVEARGGEEGVSLEGDAKDVGGVLRGFVWWKGHAMSFWMGRRRKWWVICMRSSLEDGNRSSAGEHMGLDKKLCLKCLGPEWWAVVHGLLVYE